MHLTALDARHRALGARMIPFAGWEMPVQYQGLVEEHKAVRSAAGLFDLSHMGELYIEGPEAGAALDYAIVTAPGKLAVGRAHYSMICAPDGGVIDDLIVYRLGEQKYLVVANASNAPTVSAELRERIARFDARLDDASMRTSLVAIQGPRAAAILQPQHRVRSQHAQVLRRHRDHRLRRAGAAGPDRIHRRGRLRTLRRVAGWRRRLGHAAWPRVPRRVSCRWDSAPATRSASRPGCRCTARNSIARRRRTRRVWAEW